MTKTEQMRLKAWRYRVLRQAEAVPRTVAQTCRHFGVSTARAFSIPAGAPDCELSVRRRATANRKPLPPRVH